MEAFADVAGNTDLGAVSGTVAGTGVDMMDTAVVASDTVVGVAVVDSSGLADTGCGDKSDSLVVVKKVADFGSTGCSSY